MVLTRNPPPYVGYVIEEAVLERDLGGPQVLKEQLRHLLECNRTMNHLTLQVMPTKRHTHVGLMGPMQLMGTGGGAQLRQNLGAVGWTLTPEQMARLDAASSRMAPYPYFPYERQEGFGRLNPLLYAPVRA